MKFRTEIEIKDAPKILSPERLVLFVGSCFSDNVGARMLSAGWPAIVNPCGVVYNPVSMAVLFQLALTHRAMRRPIVESSITRREGRYVSWFMGSKANGETPGQCVDSVCECIDRLEEGIERASAIVLTFGTSDVWLLRGTDCAVGNCHKHPAAEFERRRVSIGEIADTWRGIMEAVRQRNPEVNFIFTVSPRRYLSDGFAENTRQKAVLILACEQLCSNNNNPLYFPAYEILGDDLRDYRFYAKDLLHPSEAAIEYIWEKFTECYLAPRDLELLKNMERQQKKKEHRPLLQ